VGSFRLRPRITYANVTATLALVVALGGTSYAALTVGGENVRDDSLTGADIRDGSLTAADLAFAQRAVAQKKKKKKKVKRGPPGPAGATGPPGQNGAAFFGEPLPSGKTEVGPWVTKGNSWGGSVAVQFNPPLPAPLDSAHLHYLPSPIVPTAECPGHGEAAPGHLCMYASVNLSFQSFQNPTNFASVSAATFGVNALFFTDGSTSGGSGSWAVTAP
jgi:hypothetical protein